MITKIDEKQGLELYHRYMENDFPEDERPTYQNYKRLTLNHLHEIFIYKENNKEVAYFISIEKDNNILITHLAVIKEYRGKGIGKKLLENIIEYYKNKNLIIVEAESEEMANNEKELEIIKRRKKYYMSAGFIQQDNLKYLLTDVDYSILIYYYKNKLDNEEIIKIIKNIYKNILPNENYLVIENKKLN